MCKPCTRCVFFYVSWIEAMVPFNLISQLCLQRMSRLKEKNCVIRSFIVNIFLKTAFLHVVFMIS